MINVITKVEQDWSRPTGVRRILQKVVILAADWLPGIAFLATGGMSFSGEYFMEGHEPHWTNLLSPVGVTFIGANSAARDHRVVSADSLADHSRAGCTRISRRLCAELETHYHQVLTEVTQEVLVERKQNEAFQKEIAEVSKWLAEREQAASVVNLYGR